MRLNDLTNDRVSQIVLTSEMMKQRTLGRARTVDDAVQATALEAVLVKFFESGFQDFSSGFFYVFAGSDFHLQPHIQTRRYVCPEKTWEIFFK